MKPEDEHSLESLRVLLRERGYLNRGFDRMILSGAGAPRAWLKGAAKAGLVSGVFLSVALLIVLVIQNNPPITSLREILLLAFYLILLCSLLTLSVEAVAGAAARALAALFRRQSADPGRLSWAIGSVVAALFAVYLSLWWGGREGSQAFSTRLLVLGVILITSLTIGRLTRMTALLSLLRVDRPLRSAFQGPRRALILAACLLVAAALAIPWMKSRIASAHPPGVAKFSIHARPGRVLWIGVDGLGMDLFSALRREDRLPGLADLARRGCLSQLTRPASDPPAVWVSAATGFVSRRHGIPGVESASLPGISTPLAPSPGIQMLARAAEVLNPWLGGTAEIPLSGMHRKDKTVWEIAGEKGIASAVVNWWATWPAEEGPGLRVSERAYFRIEAGGKPDREVFPPQEMSSLQSDFARLSQQDSPADGLPERRLEREAAKMDTFHLEQADKAWREGKLPLVAVYLNGLDLMASSPETAEDRGAKIARDRRLVDHLDFLDHEVTAFLDHAAGDDFIVIEGDPGRGEGSEDDRGLLILVGPGIGAGEQASGRLLDVTPTLLRILGFPLSKEMEGRPLASCFTPGSPLSLSDPPAVASYGKKAPPVGGGSQFDSEVLEKLRSLGYIR